MTERKQKKEFPFSKDWSVFERGERVRVRGKIKAIYSDLKKYHVPPLSDHYTVTLLPDKNYTYYLKFRTKEELEALSFTVGENVDVEGDLTRHSRRGTTKHILTDVKRTR
jgi:hypothetical protein